MEICVLVVRLGQSAYAVDPVLRNHWYERPPECLKEPCVVHTSFLGGCVLPVITLKHEKQPNILVKKMVQKEICFLKECEQNENNECNADVEEW